MYIRVDFDLVYVRNSDDMCKVRDKHFKTATRIVYVCGSLEELEKLNPQSDKNNAFGITPRQCLYDSIHRTEPYMSKLRCITFNKKAETGNNHYFVIPKDICDFLNKIGLSSINSCNSVFILKIVFKLLEKYFHTLLNLEDDLETDNHIMIFHE